MERHIIQFGNREIEFQVQRKKVKNINLNVRPNLDVVVSANNQVPQEYIESYVRDKATWILRNLDNFSSTLSEEVPRHYVSGETVKFMGKQYRLRVLEGTPETVKISDKFIDLTIKDQKNLNKKQGLLSQWLRQQAEETFESSLETVYSKVHKYGIKKPGILIRSMKARWGSCLRDKGMIILNLELIRAPMHCIEYVVLHELLHFIYPKHDDKFYGHLTVLMPDWVQRKDILDDEIVLSL